MSSGCVAGLMAEVGHVAEEAGDARESNARASAIGNGFPGLVVSETGKPKPDEPISATHMEERGVAEMSASGDAAAELPASIATTLFANCDVERDADGRADGDGGWESSKAEVGGDTLGFESDCLGDVDADARLQAGETPAVVARNAYVDHSPGLLQAEFHAEEAKIAQRLRRPLAKLEADGLACGGLWPEARPSQSLALTRTQGIPYMAEVPVGLLSAESELANTTLGRSALSKLSSTRPPGKEGAGAHVSWFGVCSPEPPYSADGRMKAYGFDSAGGKRYGWSVKQVEESIGVAHVACATCIDAGMSMRAKAVYPLLSWTRLHK